MSALTPDAPEAMQQTRYIILTFFAKNQMQAPDWRYRAKKCDTSPVHYISMQYSPNCANVWPEQDDMT